MIRFLFVSLLLASTSLKASPWIGTLEPQLHHDLQILKELGHINNAITSFPVPWKGVVSQLEQIDLDTVSPMARTSTLRLMHYANLYQGQQTNTSLTAYVASEESRFTDFSGAERHKSQLTARSDVYFDRVAIQVSVNRTDDGELNLDNSFAAVQIGEWNLRAGSLEQWWGPAQSSSLILSNNARPTPALTISRATTEQSKSKWLSWLGSWFFTAQMGQLESNRSVPDTKLWQTRFNFSPFEGLEIGASWAAMWGGEGFDNSASAFFDILTFSAECADGSDSCDDALDTKKGNQLAGFDFKYSFSLGQWPFSLYAQRIGEDANRQLSITDQANLVGLSSYVSQHKVFLEYSDTNVACSGTSTVTNCYYEHGTYRSGYRAYERALGSTFDSDAKMISLGAKRHLMNGSIYEVQMRFVELNKDGTRPSPVVKGAQEDVIQLTGYYQTQFNDWRVKVGGTIEHSNNKLEDISDTDGQVYTEISYAF